MTTKIDLKKAYNMFSWKFIHENLMKVVMHSNIVELILKCISSSSFQVLWNGEETHCFKTSKGIRQWDPLSSPYNFVLCVERLEHIIRLDEERVLWKPIKM